MKDITIPAFDTPSADMTPIVLAAVKDGATVTPHPDDASKIIVTFADDKSAKKFQSAVAPFLPVEEEPKVETPVEEAVVEPTVEPKAE
jgi:ABC-type sugar transport system substrate-binding protein